MPMSGFLRHHRLKRSDKTVQAGFTLFEVLIVVLVMGLIAGIVVPNLPAQYDRLRYALEKESVIRSINNLPYTAYESNNDLVLLDVENEGVEDDIVGDVEQTASQPVDQSTLNTNIPFRTARLRKADVDLPESWRLLVDEPIFYRPSGFCSGGRLVLVVGELRYRYQLASPACQLEEEL